MKLLVTLMMVAVFAFTGTESISYQHHLVLKENVFDVHWYVNTSTDRFYFKVVATTTGWVGLALTTYEGGEDMINYDTALGGVRNTNMSYLKDYWSVSEIKPTLDSRQDLVLTSAMESGGKTTIEFNRLAVTGDTQQDTPLKTNKPIFLAWAIGTQDATDDTTFQKHPDKQGGGRGHTNVGYNMYTATPMPSTTIKPTTTGSVVVPSLITLMLIQFILQLIN